MREPIRIWWARPRKLCALERPGGGGRSHRPERREAEIAWLAEHGVRTVDLDDGHAAQPARRTRPRAWSTTTWPCPRPRRARTRSRSCWCCCAVELRRAGAVAVHGNRHTDFVAALCAAHLHEHRGLDPVEGLSEARAAGLMVTPEACALLGVDYEAVQPRSRIASATASG